MCIIYIKLVICILTFIIKVDSNSIFLTVKVFSYILIWVANSQLFISICYSKVIWPKEIKKWRIEIFISESERGLSPCTSSFTLAHLNKEKIKDWKLNHASWHLDLVSFFLICGSKLGVDPCRNLPFDKSDRGRTRIK